MHTTRRTAHLLVLAGATLALGACGGTPSDSGNASASISKPQTPKSTATPITPSASVQSPAGPARCRTADLRVTLSAGEGTAGSIYYKVVLTNRSGAACRTGGYGGVSLVGGGNGSPIGAPADRAARDKVTAITLRPGRRAEATLQVTTAENYPAKRCRPTAAAGFRIYPPNETHSVFVKRAVTACANPAVHLLTLSPYQPTA